jgi:hypothetical protein
MSESEHAEPLTPTENAARMKRLRTEIANRSATFCAALGLCVKLAEAAAAAEDDSGDRPNETDLTARIAVLEHLAESAKLRLRNLEANNAKPD